MNFMNVDFANNIPPRNEFPTIKLYKKIEGAIHYWQIYGSSLKKMFLVIGHGKLGESGEYIEISDQGIDELRNIYRQQIIEKKKEEYYELHDLYPMVLQIQTNSTWSTPSYLEFRNEIWDYLDGFLFWTGNGKVSGSGIGTGTLNLFFEAVEPALAVTTIVEALEKKEIRHPYLIVQEKIIPEKKNASGVEILHPKDFKGEFSLNY